MFVNAALSTLLAHAFYCVYKPQPSNTKQNKLQKSTIQIVYFICTKQTMTHEISQQLDSETIQFLLRENIWPTGGMLTRERKTQLQKALEQRRPNEEVKVEPPQPSPPQPSNENTLRTRQIPRPDIKVEPQSPPVKTC